MSKIIKIVAVLFATTILFTACTNTTNQNSSSIVALEEEKMQELKKLYEEQNFFLAGTRDNTYTDVYENNRNFVYIHLFYYNWKENQDLTYEEIVEYLSSEYEDDGTVRIYNNGNWPRIERYINFYNQEERDTAKEIRLFETSLTDATNICYKEMPEIGTQFYLNLSKHNLYEVMESVKDENYVPNFTPGNKFEVGEATKK